jgi:D-amino-acid oxidase
MNDMDAVSDGPLERFLANIDQAVDERLSHQRVEEYLQHVKEVAGAKPPDSPVSGAIRSDQHVLVIGAGVSGLTTAICVAEAGFKVRVLSRELPLHTTSVAAGASWTPYKADERCLAWSQETLVQLRSLTANPDAGVHMVQGILASRGGTPAPAWAVDLPNYRPCRQAELPQGFRSGWRYTIPLVDMPVYLRYLTDRLRHLGVTIELAAVTSLDQLSAPAIVNCAGGGAAELAEDQKMAPMRGQLVVVENPGIDWFFEDMGEDPADPEELTYFMPHGDVVVLGGSYVPDTGDSLAPDPQVSAGIIARAAEIEPKLAGAKVLGHRVGIRPTRPTVRLERIVHNGRPVIHNYGHGGAGVTVSWGCASEVVSYLRTQS